jgi:hypothetical protein
LSYNAKVSNVPLLRDVTRLKVVHRQRVMRQGDADPAPPFASAGLGSDVLSAAAAGWQSLLATEYESVVIASWMTSALTRIGAPLDLIGSFGRVVEDEIRHVDLCAQMIESFGAVPTVPVAAPPPFPTSAANAREAQVEIISGMVSFFCVFEHLSGLLFAHSIEAASEARAKWALGEIFRDEAFHGAFGFETAKYYVPTWTVDERKTLSQRVTLDIKRFEQRLHGGLPADDELGSPLLAALQNLGLLSPPALLATFYNGVQHELIPRLAELGLDSL